MALVAGSRLGPYEILGLVGSGGMGEVYRARDPRLGRDVAVKVLPDDFAADRGRLRRFEQEARAVAALSHPNVVIVHDVGADAGRPYAVTELLEGETLGERLRHGALPLREAVETAVHVAQGLSAAHAKRIAHRDLKPANVFLTADGRVKILDFGLARWEGLSPEDKTASAATEPGTALGTVGYMSPEQVRGGRGDSRSDIFSFGVLLYEMVSGRHPFRRTTGVETQAAILREEPLALSGLGLPEALERVMLRCLEKRPEDRFHSAHDLALALQSIAGAPLTPVPLPTPAGPGPYPGLRPFTEEQKESFFGREAEVAALWEKLQRRRMLPLIGPSGVGKTSFLRAGLVPARPSDWRCVTTAPGRRPFASLARALVPELSSDTEALQELVGFDDPDVAVRLVGRWRRRHAGALVVVDQLEELFTLNPPEVQTAFTELLRRLCDEADVHVLLSLRDDFLFACHAHPPLAEVFTEVTPLGPLAGEALRRALVEPAQRCGFAFEDEALVEEMCGAVEGERGALPPLAFCAAELWERRDRERKLLTRAACGEIGGVAGALAQHAEATLERIGAERQGIVREIFRNLVTAQGTRAACEREELLSVFPDRRAAEAVLGALVDARLLTSYEEPAAEGTEEERHRIEIVHESLLKAWPRLVRWLAQDEEGALLRDQLKQAAHLWQEKGRPADILWSGTSYQEFELWRRRYPGVLTALEEDFAKATVERARRRKRLVRTAVAAVVVGLSAVAIVVSWSRHQAVHQAERAEQQARLALASKLATLGRNQLDTYPTAALAFARKSLETADNAEARRLTVEALWRSPTARIFPIAHYGSWSGSFSPDGRHLAAYTFSEFVLLFTEDGGAPRELGGFKAPTSVTAVSFTPDGRALVTWAPGEPTLRMVSVPDGREIRVFSPALPDGRPGFLRSCDFLDRGVLFHVAERATGDALVHLGLWPYDGGPHTPVGAHRGGKSWSGASVDRRGLRLALSRGARAIVRPLAGDDRTPERDIGLSAEGGIAGEVVNAAGDRLAVAEGSGRLTVWSLDSRSVTRLRELRFANADGDPPPTFAPSGSLLSWSSSADKQVALWDLSAPPDAAPRLLRRSDTTATKTPSFHPSGDWLAVFDYDTGALWAIRQPWARVLRGSTGLAGQIAFTRDSRRLLSCGMNGLHLWPLDPGSGAGQQRISPPEMLCYGMALSPEEREVLWGAVGNYGTRLSGGASRCLLRAHTPVDEVTGSVAIDRSGRWAAIATAYSRPPARKLLRLFDWPSGRLLRQFPLAPPGEPEEKWDGSGGIVFDSQGRVIVAGGHGVRRFDAETGASTWIRKLTTTAWAAMAASQDGGQLFVLESAEWTAEPSPPVPLALVNPGAGTERPITSHGTTVMAIAIDPTGQILVSGDAEGVVRVGRADGSEPHLLLGHGASISNVAVSPDGRWVASSSGSEIRLWPMPDLSKCPPHTLPYEELMAKLRSFTNLRVVEDPASATGYRLDIGPFPGWKDVPEW